MSTRFPATHRQKKTQDNQIEQTRTSLLHADVNLIYRYYLVPTLGSALAMSIYSVIDSVAVGQYAGPAGSAALAVVNPIYVIMSMIAFLFSTGGSVCFGNAIGEGDKKLAEEYFTISAIMCGGVTSTAWIVFRLWYREIFIFFGATEDVIPIAAEYGLWIIRFFPVIVLPDFLSPFLRIDKDPIRAMTGVVTGGGINMFLDWLLVFPVGMGVKGAAIATVIGTAAQCTIMLSHFASKRNHLKMAHIRKAWEVGKSVVTTGLAASLLDIGNVVTAILMNNEISHFGGTVALGIYGVLNTVTMLFHALFVGVGQTIQPGVSINYGAGEKERTAKFLHYAVITAMCMGIGFTAIGELMPSGIIKMFMKTTEEVISVAPILVRIYFIAFPFLGYTVIAIYYLQSILRTGYSNILAISRSVILPTFFLSVLSKAFGITGIFLAIPTSEIAVSVIASLYIIKVARQVLKDTDRLNNE